MAGEVLKVPDQKIPDYSIKTEVRTHNQRIIETACRKICARTLSSGQEESEPIIGLRFNQQPPSERENDCRFNLSLLIGEQERPLSHQTEKKAVLSIKRVTD